MIYQRILGQSFWLKWPEHNPLPPSNYLAGTRRNTYSASIRRWILLLFYPLCSLQQLCVNAGVRMFSFPPSLLLVCLQALENPGVRVHTLGSCGPKLLPYLPTSLRHRSKCQSPTDVSTSH
ncbi:hypothetical protein BO99DRAFT_27091 [Aspergillus violaceofuscus CBS 115571]|uniref:Uncharacterized protein n=1 Tax=Aspergillus violaceofuscus (strain CBS 115571) TaxID=1450538 RepID=A0A2V5HE84_ASPV1|nr:hypothetical protein BO99DRAFT_27091 [Aspergillus violaceofuscus CBS 115571]